MDEKRVNVYCYLIKTGKKVISDIPADYQSAVTAKLEYFTIADLDKISELEIKYNLLSATTSELNDNLGGFIDYIFETYNI